jgi:hypothetical protein
MSKDNFLLNVPFNSVSYGALGISLARECYKRGLNPCIAPIGNVDLSQQRPDEGFNKWLATNINKTARTHKRDYPSCKLWHLNGMMESHSKRQLAIFFHETDFLTSTEANILRSQDKVLVPSNYTKTKCADVGIEAHYIPMGIDTWNFQRADKQYFDDGRISFGVSGKFEPSRKRHAKLIDVFVKRFGNNRKVFLNLSIFNPFLDPEKQKQDWAACLGGQKYSNVAFYGFMDIVQYNDWLQHLDVMISLGTEEIGIPSQLSAGVFAKQVIILNAAGAKDWANSDNAILVQPNGKFKAADGVFFHEGNDYNQGNFFDFAPEAFISACEEAIKRVESGQKNEEGIKLQQSHSAEKSLDAILAHL